MPITSIPTIDSSAVVRFPNPLANGSDIHGSWGTWLPLLHLLSSFLLQGELFGVPMPLLFGLGQSRLPSRFPVPEITDDSLGLQFHQVMEPPISTFLK